MTCEWCRQPVPDRGQRPGPRPRSVVCSETCRVRMAEVRAGRRRPPLQVVPVCAVCGGLCPLDRRRKTCGSVCALALARRRWARARRS
jgi:hypothetical protein